MTAAAILVLPLLYITLQWSALSHMRHGWHTAALLPAMFMAVALALMAVGIAARSDLAAAVLMLGLPVSTIYLLVLWPLHYMLSED